MTCTICDRTFKSSTALATHFRFRHPAQTEVRFWAMVDQSAGQDGCWPWLAGRDRDGYGTGIQRVARAHRVAWIFTHGPIPDGLQVCHTCDNPPCCNPAHLWLGTNQDNSDDAAAKGRLRGRIGIGSDNGYARLNETQVAHIKRRLLNGEHWAAIAPEYGVAKSTVWQIAKGNNWRQVVPA